MEEGQVPSPTLTTAPCPDKTPLSPFLFTIENWDELDISSRSADSLDDILDDPQSQRQTGQSGDLSTSDGVVLLSYKPLEESPLGEELAEEHASACAATADDQPMEDQLGSGSEVDDCLDVEAVIRPQRGCYDMCMLTGQHTLLDNPEGSDDEGEEPPDGIHIWYLHPDTKLETIQSQFRKQRRIAQLLRHSERKEEEERVKIVQAEKSRQQKASHAKLTRNNSSPLLPTKVKPDDFWIKEASASDDPGDEGIFVSSPLGQTEGAIVVDCAASAADASSSGSESHESGSDQSSTHDAEHKSTDIPIIVDESLHKHTQVTDAKHIAPGNQGQTSPHGSQLQDTGLQQSETIDADVTEDVVSPDTPLKEVGVWQHYEKEDIPWSPGTVKRQTHDLEEKIKSETSSEGTRRVSISSESSTECQREGDVEICDTCENSGKPTLAAKDMEHPVQQATDLLQDGNIQEPPQEISPAVSECSSSKSETASNLKSNSTGQMSDPVTDLDDLVNSNIGLTSDRSENNASLSHLSSPPRQSLSDGAVSPYRPGAREPNIYDTEEIPLEPGLVRRTKMEFEQRERSVTVIHYFMILV